jgi:hypothetical protein
MSPSPAVRAFAGVMPGPRPPAHQPPAAVGRHRSWVHLGAKLLELTLIGIWFGFAFVAHGERSQARYLAVWDAVAATYLLLRFLAMRRRSWRTRPIRATEVTSWLRPFLGPRAEFGCVLAASVAGLTSAFAVISAKHQGLQWRAAQAIVLAWLLLHAGARGCDRSADFWLTDIAGGTMLDTPPNPEGVGHGGLIGAGTARRADSSSTDRRR